MTRLRIVERPDAPIDYIRFTPSHNSPTRMERFTEFMRMNGEELSFFFALAAVALAVGIVVGAYLGVGR